MSEDREQTHRGYRIWYDPKPGPPVCDWSFVHPDFDGGPWETGGPPMDPRSGDEASAQACRDRIDELEDDQ